MYKNKEGFYFIEENENINNLKCPICGNKLSLSLVGEVTINQIMVDMEKCHLIWCVDEEENNLGYHVYCVNEVNNEE